MKRTIALFAGSCALAVICSMTFFFVFFPAWCPETCARYSPLPSQVVEVFLARLGQERAGVYPHEIAYERITTDLRERAVPSLVRALETQNTSAEKRLEAIRALGDIGDAAGTAIPAILSAISRADIPKDGVIEDYLADQLRKLGASQAWNAGLANPDPWISGVVVDSLRRSGRVDFFLLLWTALKNNVVSDRASGLEALTDIDYKSFTATGPLRPEIVADVADVEQNGPVDMKEAAKAIRFIFTAKP